MLTHRNLLANALHFQAYGGVRPRHRVADRGAAVPRRRLDRRARHGLARRPPGRAAGVRPGPRARPDRGAPGHGHARRADDAGGAQRGAAGPSTRRVVAALDQPRRIADRHRDAAPGPPGVPRRRALHIYGATETSPIATVAARTRSESSTDPRARSCGQPAIGVEIAVLDADGAAVPPGDGRRGRRPRRQRDARATGTSPTRRPRRSSTGGTAAATSATVDDEAYLFLVDRAKDMIVTGGENVYSTEVEDVLYRHPAVLEAAVFGSPRRAMGRGGARRRRAAGRRLAAVAEDELIAPLPRLDRRLQGPQAHRGARRAAAEVGRRQGPQARAAGSVLGRPRHDDRRNLTGSGPTLTRVANGHTPAVSGRVRARLRESARALGINAWSPNLRYALASLGAAWTAEWAFTVAVSVVAFRDGGAVAVGFVTALRMLVAAALLPIATPFADRFPASECCAGRAGCAPPRWRACTLTLALDGPSLVALRLRRRRQRGVRRLPPGARRADALVVPDAARADERHGGAAG